MSKLAWKIRELWKTSKIKTNRTLVKREIIYWSVFFTVLIVMYIAFSSRDRDSTTEAREILTLINNFENVDVMVLHYGSASYTFASSSDNDVFLNLKANLNPFARGGQRGITPTSINTNLWEKVMQITYYADGEVLLIASVFLVPDDVNLGSYNIGWRASRYDENQVAVFIDNTQGWLGGFRVRELDALLMEVNIRE